MIIEREIFVFVGILCAVLLSDSVGWHAAWIVPSLLLSGVSVLVLFQACRFLLISREARRRRLRILETDYGRNAGWYVELEGRHVALLSRPEHFEMFWVSYLVEPLTEDPDERHRMLTDPNWWHANNLVYRSRELNEVATFAFAGGGGLNEAGRIAMRGLYLDAEAPNLWERMLLYLRRPRESPEG